jgi:hypothetical protein
MRVQYITDAKGRKKAAVVPIAEWEGVLSALGAHERREEETAHLLNSEVMRRRLAAARARAGGKTLEEVKDALGL